MCVKQRMLFKDLLEPPDRTQISSDKPDQPETKRLEISLFSLDPILCLLLHSVDTESIRGTLKMDLRNYQEPTYSWLAPFLSIKLSLLQTDVLNIGRSKHQAY